MIGGQDGDSCGRSGKTPQEPMRRGGSAAARGKRKSCTEINSGLISKP
ncbi:hypothetical protein [Priestia megaterium]|nr:hypothetical protein [Priestia megaterium]